MLGYVVVSAFLTAKKENFLAEGKFIKKSLFFSVENPRTIYFSILTNINSEMEGYIKTNVYYELFDTNAAVIFLL